MLLLLERERERSAALRRRNAASFTRERERADLSLELTGVVAGVLPGLTWVVAGVDEGNLPWDCQVHSVCR